MRLQADNDSIGTTHATDSLEQARAQLAALRRVYPHSVLEVLAYDDDLGSWMEATDDDLDRISAVATATALADIQRQALTRITWVIDSYYPNRLGGQAKSREAVEEYARILGVEVKEERRANRVHVEANGVHMGVCVEVTTFELVGEATS